MRFEILDVGHGFCAYAEADNGETMVFDCGHKTEPEFLPSEHLRGLGKQTIDRLVITNYDEDHISDLPNIQRLVPAKVLRRNKSISSAELRALKLRSGPLSPAMQSMIDIMDRYTSDVVDPPQFPGIAASFFCNNYGTDFSDTNNVSLVTFLRCRDTTFLLPGDLETAGWQKLLSRNDFCSALRGVDVFIASHHGRETGYCEDVFAYCAPGVIVVSDGPKQFATQETVNKYSEHARGVPYSGQHRKVLTTRNDGGFRWDW
jgi:beta-lactamase superfamily II metal-dependent hydrolase